MRDKEEILEGIESELYRLNEIIEMAVLAMSEIMGKPLKNFSGDRYEFKSKEAEE